MGSLGQLGKNDKIGIAVALLFSFVFLLLLILNQNDLELKSNKESIASIVFKKDQVKKKELNGLNWFEVRRGHKLSQGDEIFTESEAEAKVQFHGSHSLITIPPKSLVKIQTRKKEIVLEIKEGYAVIKIQSHERINLKSSTEEYALDATSLSTVLVKNENGRLRFENKSGELTIMNKSNPHSKFLLKLGQILNADHEMTVSDIAILEPTSGASFQVNSANESLMRIKLSRTITGEIFLADNRDFKMPIFIQKIENANFFDFKYFDEGNYFVKVVADKKGSNTIKFSLKNGNQFIPEDPLDSKFITGIGINESVMLKWNGGGFSSEIEVETSEGKVQSFQVNAGKDSIDLKNIKTAIFKWRGRFLFNLKKSEFSAWQKIKLQYKRPFKIIKDIPAKFNSYEGSFELKWDRLEEEELFNIQIFGLEEEAQSSKEVLLNEMKTTKNIFNFNKFKAGIYKIRISSQTYPGMENILERTIKIFNPILVWKYQEMPLDFESFDPVFLIPLKYQTFSKEKIYYSFNDQKELVSSRKISNVYKITINSFGKTCIKARGKPQLLLLESKEYCVMLKKKKAFPFLPLKEKQVLKHVKVKQKDAYIIFAPLIPNAVKYEFNVFKDANGEKLVFKSIEEHSQTKWISNRSGVYYLRYRVFDIEGRVSDYSSFSKIIFPISPNSKWN
ncbi:MAG: hypothetical protein KBD76_12205 [Bacteriovorax sp.]|nr:hypothetical protein [Bacteriovorax sp.]